MKLKECTQTRRGAILQYLQVSYQNYPPSSTAKLWYPYDYNGISGAIAAQKRYYLDGRDNEASLGSILGWAKSEVGRCTDVTFRNRSDGPMVSCAELPYSKLRLYIEDGMPTEDYPAKPEMDCFVMTAFAHCTAYSLT